LRIAGTLSHGTAKRNYALIQLMLQTGLRVGEIAALRHEDLRINERSGSVRVREGKGRKEREVPLNTTARKALRDYLDTLEVCDHHAPVFRSSRGTPLSVRAIQQSVSTIAARAGIKRIPVSAHTLRHTFAVNYLKGNRGNLVELSNVMGHESLNTTAIYTRPSREDLSNDLERSPLNVLGE
jgi:integrase/recombinase XerC